MFRTILGFLGTKIGISIIFSIVIIGLAFAIKSTDFVSGKLKANPTLSAEKEATKQVFEKDSDSDGLKDWEEALYGTDPLNPDTKGGGLGDTKEIENERLAATKATTTAEKAPTLTATEKFSRELFTKYLEAKKSGREITPELSASIAQELVAKGYDEGAPAFDDSVLITVNTSDPTFIRSYGNNLAEIVLTPIPEGTSNELLILEQIMERGVPSEKNLSDLKKLADRYTSIRDRLVKIKIPLGAKDAHAQLVQAIEIMLSVTLGIRDIDNDPIGTFEKTAKYEDGVTILQVSSLRFKQFFLENEISFSPGERGIIFIQ